MLGTRERCWKGDRAASLFPALTTCSTRFDADPGIGPRGSLDSASEVCEAVGNQGVTAVEGMDPVGDGVGDPLSWSEPTGDDATRASAEARLTPRSYALVALLDLAYDVSSYLRHHAKPGVRIAAAVLLAGSLAACSGSSPGPPGSSSTIQPLTQEVRRGLPTAPGQYLLVDGTLGRDARGVYYFAWRRAVDPVSVQNDAAVSRLRLGQASSDYLEIPSVGDPILYLTPDVSIPFVQPDELQRTGGYYGYHPYWRPWIAGGYRGTGYYDPPARTYSSGSVTGSSMSTSPRAFAERTVGLARAVSGRAGGTGSGTAATAKSGAGFGSATHGGAAAAKAGAFSAGHASAGFGSSS